VCLSIAPFLPTSRCAEADKDKLRELDAQSFKREFPGFLRMQVIVVSNERVKFRILPNPTLALFVFGCPKTGQNFAGLNLREKVFKNPAAC
jgi:hypothetical protein